MKISYIIPIILVGIIFPSAYAVIEVEHGKDFDRKYVGVGPDGNPMFSWNSAPTRIQDAGGNWINYRLIETSDNIRFESANVAVNFNKDTCSLRLYDAGVITNNESPIISSVTNTLKESDAERDDWISSSMNVLQCVTDIKQGENEIEIKATKSAFLGSDFTVLYKIHYGGSVETVYRYTNNDLTKPNSKYGFTESFDGDFVIRVGAQTYDTSKITSDIFIGKDELKDKRITVSKGKFTISYDPQDYIHDYLWGMKIKNRHANFDFTNAKSNLPITQTLEIDPTFGYVSGFLYHVNTGTTVAATCGSPNVVSNNTADRLVYIPASAANDYCVRMTPEWPITSLPSTLAGVQAVQVRYDIQSTGNPINCDWRGMQFQPSTNSATTVWNDAGNGTVYAFNNSGCASAANDIVLNLSSNATSDLKTARNAGQNWWAVGIKAKDETRGAATHTMNFGTGGATQMELRVNYTIPVPNPPTSFVATPTGRAVQFSWTASNPASTVTGYFIGRSLDNSTWPAANKTSVGNVTSYLHTGYWGINKLYYVNVTAANVSGNSTGAFSSLTTDNRPSAPLNPYATGRSDNSIIIRWSPPSSTGNDPITGYRIEYCQTCTSWTLLVNKTNTVNYNHTSTNSAQYKYRMAAWNNVGLSPYTANFTGNAFRLTTGSVSLSSGVVGDTIQLNTTISITHASPSPVTVSQLKLYKNGTLVETKNVNVQIANASSSSNFDPFWYRMTTGQHYSFKVWSTVSNATGTVGLASSNVTTTREYDPSYFNALTDPAVEGSVNYTMSRFDDEDGVQLKVNRINVAGGSTWEINCILQTNTEAAATRNQTLNWPGTWRNYSNVGYFNSTWTDLVNTHGYVTCFNPPGILFTTTSYTNSSLALFGIEIFDNSYGAMLGVPVGIFFLAMAGSMANKRTAPTWIIVVLAMAGTMAAIGFFTLNPLVWGLALVTGLLGVLVNQKVF